MDEEDSSEAATADLVPYVRLGLMKTTRFRAIMDDGTVVVVVQRRQENWFTPVNGPRQLASVVEDFELAHDGSEIIKIDSETFKIVESDQIIRKL